MDLFSGSLGLAGWQWLFLIEGIPSILVGFWVMGYLDSSIQDAKWLTEEEKALAGKQSELEEKHKPENTAHRRLQELAKFICCPSSTSPW